MKIDPNKTYSIAELQYIFSKDLYKTAINYNKLNINQSVNSIAESNLNSNFKKVFDNVNEKIKIFENLINKLGKIHNNSSNSSIKKHIDYLLYLKNILETKKKNDIKIINLFNAVMNNTNEISEKIKKIIRFNNGKKNINTLQDIRKLFNSIKDLTEIKNKDNKGGGIKNRSIRKSYKKIISQNKLKTYNLSLKKNLKELINNLKLIENNNKGGTNNKLEDISNYNDLLKELKNNNGKNNYTTELNKIKMKYEDGLKDNIAHFNSICKALKEYLTILFNSTKTLLKNFINDGNEFMEGKNTIFNNYKDSVDKIIKDFLDKEIKNRQKKINMLQNKINSKRTKNTETNISNNQTSNTETQSKISILNIKLDQINEKITELNQKFKDNKDKLNSFNNELNNAENINNNNTYNITYNNTINKLKNKIIEFRKSNKLSLQLNNNNVNNYIVNLSKELETKYESYIQVLITQKEQLQIQINNLKQQIINRNIQQKNQQNIIEENKEYKENLKNIYLIIQEESNKLQQMTEVYLMFSNSEYIERIHEKNDKYLEILNNSNSNNLNIDIYLNLYELNNDSINFDDRLKQKLNEELNKTLDNFIGHFKELYQIYGITLKMPINLDTNEYFE